MGARKRDRRITVAAVQPPYPVDASAVAHHATRAAALELLNLAAAGNCDLICLPEYLNSVGLGVEAARREAATTGELKAAIAKAAAASGAFVLVPLLERRGARLYNTSHLFDRRGKLVFSYDKVHLTVSETRELGVTAGDRLGVAATALGKLAVATCYDVYFPELFAAFLRRDVKLVLFPSLQRSENPDAVLSMVATRAMDCCAYVVRAAYGCPGGVAWRPGLPYGFSCIVHPDGTVLANAGHYAGLAVACVDWPPDWRKPRCHGHPDAPVRSFLLEDRRPDVYQEGES